MFSGFFKRKELTKKESKNRLQNSQNKDNYSMVSCIVRGLHCSQTPVKPHLGFTVSHGLN